MGVFARKRFPENAKKKAADAGYRKHGPGEGTSPFTSSGRLKKEGVTAINLDERDFKKQGIPADTGLLAWAVLATVSGLSSGASGSRHEARSTFVS